MSEYEKCVLIRKSILRIAMSVCVYNWSDDYSLKQIKLIKEGVSESTNVDNVDISELSRIELIDLGFGLWSDRSEILLIPFWLYPFLKDDVQSISISGEVINRKENMDNDHRCGLLAYGIIPKS